MLNLTTASRHAACAATACLLLVAINLEATAQKILYGSPISTSGSLAFVAAHTGIFKKHGLDVEIQLAPAANATIPALIAGGMQVSGPTPSAVIAAVEQGLELVVLAGGLYVGKESKEPAILVKPESPIKLAKDFEGKRISVVGLNSFLSITFNKWMKDNGGESSKIIYVESALPLGVDLLRSGQVDAIISVFPFIGMALGQKVGRVVSVYASGLGDPHALWFTASRAWVKANPKQAKAFRTAIFEAHELATKDPSVLWKSNIAFLPIPDHIVKALPPARYRPRVTADDVNWWNTIMKEQKLVDTPVDPKAFLYQ
jgi:NitT/TauT family transport system substrate-binding protein